MEEKKKKLVCIPSVNAVSGGMTLPEAVVVFRTSDYVERKITRPMRSGIRVLDSDEPINWEEVYN